jgi:hypothetical protein
MPASGGNGEELVGVGHRSPYENCDRVLCRLSRLVHLRSRFNSGDRPAFGVGF